MSPTRSVDYVQLQGILAGIALAAFLAAIGWAIVVIITTTRATDFQNSLENPQQTAIQSALDLYESSFASE